MSRARRSLFWLIIGIIVLVPVALAEWVLRSAGLGDPILFYANASYRFAPLPNQQKTRRNGARVTIDSKGLRNSGDWSTPADAKILFVCDSVTWGGTDIDDRETFSDGVCARLASSTGKRMTCGIAAANQYGTDNMAARIRYKRFDDETILVVTVIAQDTIRGLVDAEGRFFFTKPPPGPLKAISEATTYLVWRLYGQLRLGHDAYRSADEAEVSRRSLQNLFSAIRDTDRAGRQVLFVLSPIRTELSGQESDLTRQVRGELARSGFEFLDLHGPVSKAVAAEDIYSDTMHLSVTGHRFYAEQIARVLAPHLTGTSGLSEPATSRP